MEKYNYDKLLGRMRETKYTQEKLAASMGLSATSLNLSLNNKRDFRQDEISKISELLEIPAKSIPAYFFTH